MSCVELPTGEPGPEIGRQIFEKVLNRLKKLKVDEICADSCPELNPDIIVISADKSLLFEPQNARASEVLHQCCGLVSIETAEWRERIRVHPGRSREIIDGLRMAGLTVI